MTTRIEVIRASDGLKKSRIDENQSEKNIQSQKKVYTAFCKNGAFKAFALYNHDTNELLYKIGDI